MNSLPMASRAAASARWSAAISFKRKQSSARSRKYLASGFSEEVIGRTLRLSSGTAGLLDRAHTDFDRHFGRYQRDRGLRPRRRTRRDAAELIGRRNFEREQLQLQHRQPHPDAGA